MTLSDTAIIAKNHRGRIFVMKVGPHDKLWKWYLDVRDLIQTRISLQKEIETWEKKNYNVRDGNTEHIDVPYAMQKQYSIIVNELSKQGIENYEIMEVDLVTVGEGMEMQHID